MSIARVVHPWSSLARDNKQSPRGVGRRRGEREGKKKKKRNGRTSGKACRENFGENSLSFLRSKKPVEMVLKGGSRVSAFFPLLSFWPSVFLSVGWLIRVEGGETKREREREKERERFLETRACAHVNSSRCDCRGTRRGTKANENTGLDVPLAFTGARQCSANIASPRPRSATPTQRRTNLLAGVYSRPTTQRDENDPAAFRVSLLLSTPALSLLSRRTLATLLFPRCRAPCFSLRDFSLFLSLSF